MKKLLSLVSILFFSAAINAGEITQAGPMENCLLPDGALAQLPTLICKYPNHGKIMN